MAMTIGVQLRRGTSVENALALAHSGVRIGAAHKGQSRRGLFWAFAVELAWLLGSAATIFLPGALMRFCFLVL
jgi:hypothetical protein